jgi:DNA-binding transcriptional MerR regulator
MEYTRWGSYTVHSAPGIPTEVIRTYQEIPFIGWAKNLKFPPKSVDQYYELKKFFEDYKREHSGAEFSFIDPVYRRMLDDSMVHRIDQIKKEHERKVKQRREKIEKKIKKLKAEGVTGIDDWEYDGGYPEYPDEYYSAFPINSGTIIVRARENTEIHDKLFGLCERVDTHTRVCV